MLRSLARFNGPEASDRTPSLADFITTTSGFRFSVHTGAALVIQERSQFPDRLGCFSFRCAFASLWRMRSRLTENCWPIPPVSFPV
jgi:hypothetical protein